ncbi:MAG TPA: hypothetical protein PLP14_04350, partial [Chitinophagaceae bacterium]|nr:hypothetical protein [Chitinophagaceae bacterium]
MNKLFLFFFLCLSFQVQAQLVMSGTPDSVANLSFPGSTGQYTISNPLVVSGTSFSNPPITVSCIMNCKSDYLYFNQFGFTLPLTAIITGIELVHSRGACNSGSYTIDTLQLCWNGNPMGAIRRDSSSISETDTLGGAGDLWGLSLTPSQMNDPQFGVMIHSTGSGICTYAQFMVELRIHYTLGSGIETTLEGTGTYIYSIGRSTYLHLPSQNVSTTIEAYSLDGTLSGKQKVYGENNKLNFDHFSAGIYLLRLSDIPGVHF